MEEVVVHYIISTLSATEMKGVYHSVTRATMSTIHTVHMWEYIAHLVCTNSTNLMYCTSMRPGGVKYIIIICKKYLYTY